MDSRAGPAVALELRTLGEGVVRVAENSRPMVRFTARPSALGGGTGCHGRVVSRPGNHGVMETPGTPGPTPGQGAAGRIEDLVTDRTIPLLVERYGLALS
jgi:hypothetical protein